MAATDQPALFHPYAAGKPFLYPFCPGSSPADHSANAGDKDCSYLFRGRRRGEVMSLEISAEDANLEQLQDVPVADILQTIDQGLVHLPTYRELYYPWERQQ